MKKNSGWPLLLIGVGALIVLHQVGIHFGHFAGTLMSYLFPAALIALGIYGIKRGSFFGWIITVAGSIMLLNKLSWLLILIAGAAVIYYGISLLKKGGRSKKHTMDMRWNER